MRYGAAEDRDRALESRRARTEQILRSPDVQHRVADDEHDAKGCDELQQLGRAIQTPQQRRFDERAKQPDAERGEQHRAPVTQAAGGEAADQAVGEVSAQHHERSMSKIDDARDAEDER